MTTPPFTSFQAHRYARLGYGELFTNPVSRQLSALITTALSSCAELLELVDGMQVIDPADAEDIRRVLGNMQRDFSDGVLLPVLPDRNQLAQIREDGISLHHSRQQILLAVLQGLQPYVDRPCQKLFTAVLKLMADGRMVVIRTV